MQVRTLLEFTINVQNHNRAIIAKLQLNVIAINIISQHLVRTDIRITQCDKFTSLNSKFCRSWPQTAESFTRIEVTIAKLQFIGQPSMQVRTLLKFTLMFKTTVGL